MRQYMQICNEGLSNTNTSFMKIDLKILWLWPGISSIKYLCLFFFIENTFFFKEASRNQGFRNNLSWFPFWNIIRPFRPSKSISYKKGIFFRHSSMKQTVRFRVWAFDLANSIFWSPINCLFQASFDYNCLAYDLQYVNWSEIPIIIDAKSSSCMSVAYSKKKSHSNFQKF